MEQSENPSPTNGTASPENLDWKERLLKQVNQVRLEEKIADKNRLEEYASEMKRFRKRTLDKLLPSSGKDDDVGDTRTTNIDSPQHHHHYPAPIAPTPKPSGIGKALLGAGLLATGIGGPLGAYFVADAIKSQPAPAPIVQPAESEIKTQIKTETKVIDWTVGEPIVE